MKVIEQIERLEYIHQLIKKQQTGTPEEFAKKLHIGKRHLFRILDELRLLGAPIKYDILSKTYVYTQECCIDINIKVDVLDEQRLSSINGGIYYISFSSHLWSH